MLTLRALVIAAKLLLHCHMLHQGLALHSCQLHGCEQVGHHHNRC